MSFSNSCHWSVPWIVTVSAASGAAVASWVTAWYCQQATKPANPEIDFHVAHKLVWDAIGGAMNAAMMYVGDRLHLYTTLRELCAKKSDQYITEQDLADATGLHVRWLREWLAQQASQGVLLWKPPEASHDDPSTILYRLPHATAQVLANPQSSEYDIAMIELVPALVARAKTMLPEAFRTGIGRPYDEPDVASAIDRQHDKHVREVVIPQVLPMIQEGKLIQQLQQGIQVADLGCGAGVLMVQLAQAFPQSTFHGYEISPVALQKAAQHIAKAKLTNVFLHDATVEPLGQAVDTYDLVTIYDVLHDCTNPLDLIQQVKASLKKPTKPNDDDTDDAYVPFFLLADIPAAPSLVQSLQQQPPPATYFAISTCLCLSCSMSEAGGAGLGTLGFSLPVAQDLVVKQGGFAKLRVLLEQQNARWMEVTQ